MKSKEVLTKDNNGNDVTLFVKKPTASDFRDAKIHSSSLVAKLLKNKDGGVLVRAQLAEIRKKNGIWTEEHQARIIALSEEIDALEKKLFAGGIKKSEGKEIAFKLEDLRREQLLLLSKMNSLDETTVEAIGENEEFDYLVACCVLDECGERVFSSIDDYKEKASEHKMYFDAARELQNIIYGYSAVEDSIKERPEYKFLSQFGFMNDKMELVDKEGHLVDRQGRRVDADGYLVDESGNRVDRDGRPLDKDGNRVINFGEFLED